MKEPIDFVLTWVDDSDPEWRRERALYKGEDPDAANADCRYREWGTLRYWFRAVERHAPWVRTIHVVTNGQVPDFLDTRHPKLHMVKHSDYIPKQWLPTFCSRAIEVNLHRIPELAEHFVLFNDDMFLNAPLREDFFFRNGKPRYKLIDRPFSESRLRNAHQHARHTAMLAVARHFRKRELSFFKQLHPAYGITNLKSLWYWFRLKEFSCFSDSHIPYPLLRSTLAEIWEAEPALMEHSSECRFRADDTVNQYIVRYWDMARGNFRPASDRGKRYDVCMANLPQCERDILQGRRPLLCLNDSEHMDDYEECSRRVVEAFEKRYPERSAFEL